MPALILHPRMAGVAAKVKLRSFMIASWIVALVSILPAEDTFQNIRGGSEFSNWP